MANYGSCMKSEHGIEVLDLVIIGGGPAGMSAALVAGRARLRTLVLNAEAPRNAVTGASHGFLTRDGVHPTELLAIGKAQLAPYTSVRYLVQRVADVGPHEHGIAVVAADGTRWVSARVVIATGFVDELDRLAMPGIDAVYGNSVFPCPFCDGFEHRDDRLAIFGGQGVHHFASVVRIWSGDLIVFTNGVALSPEAHRALAHNGVGVHEEKIEALQAQGGQLQSVVLRDGRTIVRDGGFISADYSRPATTFAADLGVGTKVNDWGMTICDVDEVGRSSVPNVFVIGDAKHGFAGLIAAAAEGSACASAIVHDIAQERWVQPG